jgi:hypothetical protein
MAEISIKDEKLNNTEKVNNEGIGIGSIVANLAHPFDFENKDVLITAYNHFTPPLMIVVEKNYGKKHNENTGEKENNSYKCLHYSTINGSFELNWFKDRELKFVSNGNLSLLDTFKSKSLNSIKKELLGKMAILNSVDLELGKKKIWFDTEGIKEKKKKNSLLDYLPPLASIIDVKFIDDYKKHCEKDGDIINEKSKLVAKLRWLNNTTSKFSEQDIPIAALKQIDIKYEKYSKEHLYLFKEGFKLEGINELKINRIPVKFQEVVWKHYYYIYMFKDLFTGNLIEIKDSNKHKVGEYDGNPSEIQTLLMNKIDNHTQILSFFNHANKLNFEKRWFEIYYSDVNDRYTKRIIYVNELLEEDTGEEKKRLLLKANCLLRSGEIRHFRVNRIRGYRVLPETFEKLFI